MNFKSICDLQDSLLRHYPDAKPDDDWSITPEICPENMTGDITVNCFRFAKVFRDIPARIEVCVVQFLESHPDVESVSHIKAFVNIILKTDALFQDSVADIDRLLASGQLQENKRRKILIEYSAPNTNKPQHLGHVRNNTLGMAMTSLFRRMGHEVIPINLINDRGIHICKSMIAYQRFGQGTTPENTGKKGDHFVGEFYVRFNEELNRQLKELRSNQPELEKTNDDALFLKTEIGAATQKMLQDWETGDEEVRTLWEKMNSWVIAGFEETYRRMGVEFTHTYLESDTYLLGKDIIQQGIEQSCFSKLEDGAVAVDLGKMGEKILLRSDGTSVYITQDLGTTVKKYNDYQPDSQIWVVGDEQRLHFQMLFATLKKLGYSWAENLHHLAYGMVNLPSGKMKSREGTVVDADDLFDEMFSLAKDATLERCDGEIPEDLDQRSEIISMGALKFMLLKFNPKTTVMFDPQASIKFEGDTGPYVQYACARINSIERKSKTQGINTEELNPDWNLLDSEEEKQLAIQAFFYPTALKLASEKMDCSGLINYLLDLAKAFSRFYRDCPVLNASSETLRNTRLALCFAVRDILSDGLHTLTINIPEAM